MSHNVFKILSIATMCMAEAGGVTTRTHAWRKQKKMFSLSTPIAYYFLGINLLECCLIEIRYFHIYCKKGGVCVAIFDLSKKIALLILLRMFALKVKKIKKLSKILEIDWRVIFLAQFRLAQDSAWLSSTHWKSFLVYSYQFTFSDQPFYMDTQGPLVFLE